MMTRLAGTLAAVTVRVQHICAELPACRLCSTNSLSMACQRWHLGSVDSNAFNAYGICWQHLWNTGIVKTLIAVITWWCRTHP